MEAFQEAPLYDTHRAELHEILLKRAVELGATVSPARRRLFGVRGLANRVRGGWRCRSSRAAECCRTLRKSTARRLSAMGLVSGSGQVLSEAERD